MNWDWPQWIYFALLTGSLLMSWAKDGQPRTDKYSAGGALIGLLITQSLLYFGGFWTP